MSRHVPAINRVPCRHRAGASLSMVLRVIKRRARSDLAAINALKQLETFMLDASLALGLEIGPLGCLG